MAIVYKQSDFVGQVQRRVDDTPSTANVVEWLNAGINLMATRVNAIFPVLSPTDSNSKMPFDDKWSEIPVLYACARFKQADLMGGDAQSYMNQFEMMLRDFVMRYDVPPQYKDAPNVEQFVAQNLQVNFEITKESYNQTYGDLVVYRNNRKLTLNDDYTLTDTGFSLVVPSTLGDFVSAVWEQHEDLLEPPYTWWTW